MTAVETPPRQRDAGTSPNFGEVMRTGSCVICHASDAAVEIVDLAGIQKTIRVCETCIRLDPAQLAVLIQQRIDESGDGA
jgi:hypothetical protein